MIINKQVIIFTFIDISTILLSSTLFHQSWTPAPENITKFLLFKEGYSFTSNPFELLFLCCARFVFPFTVSKINTRSILTKVFIGFGLFQYTVTLIKLLAFSDVPEQLTYPGVYLVTFWSLLAIPFSYIVWLNAISSANNNVAEDYERLDETGTESADGNKESTSEEEARVSTSTLLKLIAYYVWADKFWYSIGLACAFGYAAGRVFIPLAVGHVVSDISQTKTMEAVFKSVLIMVVLGLSCAVFSAIRGCFFNYATDKLTNHVKSDLFSTLINQEIAFFDVNSSGALLSRLSSDCERMSSSITWNMNIFLRNFVMMTGSLIVMFVMCWRLTLVSVIIIPINSFVIFYLGAYFDKYSEERQKATSTVNKVAEEVLSSVRTMRSFASEEKESARFDLALDEVLRICKKKAICFLGYNGCGELGDNALMVSVLFYGGYLVVSGKMQTEFLITFLLYQIQLKDNIYGMTDILSSLMESVGASRKVFQYLNRTPDITPHGTERPEVKGTIELKDIHFHYPTRPNQPVLEGLNLTFNAGETVALVGPSGGGKSSIISLIEHFYEPQSGTIILDGVPIKDYSHHYYHQKIALVAQEPVLYDGSISYNITYGCDWATEEDMLNAAKMANVHTFVAGFEKGYETKCGEKGVQMSGGQKQRIAIARALVRRPAVLILDEATSALDTESEILVQEAINRCAKERTVIVIAHRLSTIEKADRIVVIKNGAVQQSGTHSELMQHPDELYYSLVSKQMFNSSNKEET